MSRVSLDRSIRNAANYAFRLAAEEVARIIHTPLRGKGEELQARSSILDPRSFLLAAYAGKSTRILN
jgi:hypothetical protein